MMHLAENAGAGTVLRVAMLGAALACNSVYGDSTGAMSPGLIATDGVDPWTDSGMAALSDDAYATNLLDPGGQGGNLNASNFGFTLPLGATITGIQVTVERHSATGNPQSSPPAFSQLKKPDGTLAGAEGLRFDGGNWAATDSTIVLGGPADLWALDLTRDEINDPAFTVVYAVTTLFGGDPDTYFVDAITAEVFFDPPVLVEPCETIVRAIGDFPAFSEAFDGGTSDLDADGLPEGPVLALMQAVACNALADAALDAALFNAYNINLIILESEADLSLLESEATAAGVQNVRSLIAFLAAGSATLEAAVKDLLAMSDPAIALTGDYVSVTCSGADCMPAAIQRRSLREEFEVFSRATRATNEPFSATGDLDGDGTNNLTEFNNVVAQGGVTSDFVIAATSPGLDGSEPIRTPGGPSGGCLIATAAYGTPLAGKIDTLRTLRDSFLLRGAFGTAFVDAYYRVSPAIARRVAVHPALASVVRYALAPVLLVAGLGLAPLRVAAYALALLLFVATYRVRRRRRARVR